MGEHLHLSLYNNTFFPTCAGVSTLYTIKQVAMDAMD